jgi:drug/metabolite transporter (DMT)-like permease
VGLALGTVYIVWGSTYLAIRVMVETVPPALGAGVRFTLAGAIMLAVIGARRGAAHIRLGGWRQAGSAALIGTLLAAGGNGLVTVAEQDVPSGLAALLVASTPMFIVLYRTLFGDRVARPTLAGVAIGFVGVGVLLLPGARPEGVPLGPALLIVLAAMSWGAGSFGAQRVPLPGDPLVSSGWQMLFGGAVMAIAGLIAGEAGDVDVGAFSTDSILAFVYLVLVGSIVAFTAYAWVVQHAPISQVATYAYVNPVVAVVLGWAILSEDVSVATLAGAAVIVASVAIVVRHEARPAVGTATA